MGMGVAAFYALQVGDEFLMAQLEGEPAAGTIEVISLPPTGPLAATAPSEGPGNGLMKRALLTLEQRGSIRAQIDQVGWIGEESIQTRGDYYQVGSGGERKFRVRQQGELAGVPTKLLRISDSRFLWSDLAWLADESETQRQVTRIDLRRLRSLVSSSADELSDDPTASDPFSWSRFGGLPMLLAGLDESFQFGAPRRMQVRNETVAAMVGRWRPERLEQLAPGKSLPSRMPQHVVIAFNEATLFPLLIEYRDARDALAAVGLPDEALLTPSRRPLLKIDLQGATFGERFDPNLFTYRPSVDDWSDQTDREVQLARTRREADVIAQATSPGVR